MWSIFLFVGNVVDTLTTLLSFSFSFSPLRLRILKLLKYTLTSKDHLSNMFLINSTNKEISVNPLTSTINIRATTNGSKMEVEEVRSSV